MFLLQLFISFFMVFLAISCSQDIPQYNTKPVIVYEKLPFSCQAWNNMDKAVNSYLESLPESQQISQIFLVNIEGNKNYRPVETEAAIYSNESKEPLVPGGMLFFSYNIGNTPEEIIAFTNSIKDYCTQSGITPPYISVDQEGGLVNRLKDITSQYPSSSYVSKHLSLEEAESFYNSQARQLCALGFHLNLAPVAEAATSSNSEFLGTRSFGSIENTINYSNCLISSFQKNNVSCTMKHFPGNTNTDPHTGLPEIKLSQEDFNTELLNVFRSILDSNPDSVLMSHAKILNSKDNSPACLSSYWVTEVLKNELGYKGLIISDDVFMGALAKNGFPPEVAAVKAIEAGVHVIMLSEKKYGSAAALLLEKSAQSPEFAQKLKSAEKKVILYKISRGILAFQKNEDLSYSLVVPENKADPSTLLSDFNKAKEEGTLVLINNRK